MADWEPESQIFQYHQRFRYFGQKTVYFSRIYDENERIPSTRPPRHPYASFV